MLNETLTTVESLLTDGKQSQNNKFLLGAEKLSYVLQNNFKNETDKMVDHLSLNDEQVDSLFYSSKVSSKFDDYFVVEPEVSKQLELLGCENSLYLAVARAILFAFHFDINQKKNESTFCNSIFSKEIDNSKKHFQFNSDMALQEFLREQLCLHWLKSVKSFTKSKYSK